MKKLPRSAPRFEGADSKGILEFYHQLEKNEDLVMHAAMVIRHGRVISEAYWDPFKEYDKKSVFSLSKSFLSVAVGFAVQEKLLDIEAPVVPFFQDEIDKPNGKYWDELKVKHLLSMSSGHKEDVYDDMLYSEDPNWVRSFFATELTYHPGTHYRYNTACSYLLSEIMHKVTGMSLHAYLTSRLFTHLDIEDTYWESSPTYVNLGGSGINVKLEDVGKFGVFLCNDGAYNGKQLLDPEWIHAATSVQIDNSDRWEHPDGSPNNWMKSDRSSGYGYHFWCNTNDSYRGDGAFGQYCFVIPRLDTVVAMLSCHGDMQRVMSTVWDYLLPALGDGKDADGKWITNKEGLPADKVSTEAEDDELVSFTQSAAHTPNVVLTSCEKEAHLMDGKFICSENKHGLGELTFTFTDEAMHLFIKRTDGESELHAGRGHWRRSYATPWFPCSSLVHPLPYKSDSSFTWLDENTLQIESINGVTPLVSRFTATLTEEGMDVVLTMKHNFFKRDFPDHPTVSDTIKCRFVPKKSAER